MNKLILVATLGAALVAVACEDNKPAKPTVANTATPPPPKTQVARPTIDKATREGFGTLPAVFESKDNPITDDKIALGRMLYFDKRLSKNHDISCNTCHDLKAFGVDGKPVSNGHKGQPGTRNSPTVYNAGALSTQFWDGRAETLEEQAKGPVMNPVEMAMPDDKRVVETLKSMETYVDAFKKAFPGEDDPVTVDNMAKAIGAFERKLVTPAPFDKYVKGEDKALSDEQLQGFAKFLEVGCTACHSGPAVGGTSLQKLGAVKPWPDQSDLGRYTVTKKDSDKMMFRVPGLRNVAKTGPYFHDGKTAKLEETIDKMAWHQLGRKLTPEDVKVLVAFMGSLTGEIPASYIEEPKLPESSEKTPAADPS